MLELQGTPNRHATYIPTGRIWPSGDFSYGYRRVDGDSRVDYSSGLDRIDRGEMSCPDRPGWAVGAWGYPVVDSTAIDFDGNREGLSVASECETQERMAGAAWADPIDLTTPRNSHSGSNRPESYGRKGITGYGRKMVKSAATLIQKMPGKRITFATVTMPSLPPQLRRELALVWPEFLRQLLQWLTRRLKRLGLIPAVCSVTEIQPGRLERYSEAYLHLHLVWPNHWARSGNWSIDVDEMRSWIAEFLQRNGLWTTDAWVNVDTQQVKKTAAGYLSKYMSKGVAEIEQFAADCGWDAVPGQWWNLSKPARDLVKKYTRQGDQVGQLLEDTVAHDLAEQNLDNYHVLCPAMLEIDGKERIVGWYGVLTADHRKRLLATLA